ncbi:MAG: hypothetical protein DCC58_01990 [Chloroflexi bacterium]|nr:MAG: hypothetical protein DCC58_01990 [Chloroflexota bacterium]
MRTLLLVALLTSATVSCIREGVSDDEKARAIAAALAVYEQQKQAGVDFSDGPCIAEEVIDDWSVDIAHNPRQEVDNKPENQCQYYRDGKTHHFVELTPEGELIRAK